MEYWLIILVVLLVLGYAMSFRVTNTRSLRSLRSFTDNVHINNIKSQDVIMKDNNTIVEKFGGGGDWDLVSTGMNTRTDDTCTGVTEGSGNGIRDMFDYSNRFIDAMFEASNDIVILQDSGCR